MSAGFNKLMPTLAAPPASGRPSVGAMSAFGALKLAARPTGGTFVNAFCSRPGILCIVALTCTSTLGIVYEPNPFTCGWYGVEKLQYGTVPQGVFADQLG